MSVAGVLWDVGNVIVRWNPRTLYSKIFPDAAECDRFLADVCSMAWHGEFDRGKPFADGIADLSARHPEYADEIRAWRARWGEMFSGAIPETESVIEDLHSRGVPQHALSNMSLEVWDEVRAMSPVFSRLDQTVLSAAEGLIKPDPAIYRAAVARTGLAPEQMLFVDDNADNIEAARALGFEVHHFTDPAALRPAIAARGLL